MDELILCVPREKIPRDYLKEEKIAIPLSKERLTDFISKENCLYMPRTKIEADEKYKQIIPYIVIRDTVGRFLCYSRSGTEKRLNGQYSLGIGGHVNINDLSLSSASTSGNHRSENDNLENIEKPFSAITNGIHREIEEETGLKFNSGAGLVLGSCLIFHGLINEKISAVGKVHLGLVFELTVNPDEPLKPGPELSQWLWMTKEEIIRQKHTFELWSQLALELVGPQEDDGTLGKQDKLY